MVNTPQWKASLYVSVIDEENVILIDEYDSTALRGRVFVLLARYLDGCRTIPELIQLLTNEVAAPELFYALNVLERGNLIVEDGDVVRREVAAFWHSRNIDASTSPLKLHQTSVAVTSVGAVDTDEVCSILAGLHIPTNLGKQDQIELVLTDDYLQSGLDEINRRALKSKRPWLLVKPLGNIIWLGPLFLPHVTGCWQCLAQRLESNRQMEAYLQHKNHLTGPVPTSLANFPSSLSMALYMTATELVKVIATGTSDVLAGAVVTLDTLTLTTEKHVLIKRPQCPACGDPHYARRAPEPIVLTNSLKQFCLDGGHRSSLPDMTYRSYKDHVSRITGAVSSLQHLTDEVENGLTYSYSAGHNFALIRYDLVSILQNMRGRSGGKGATDIQARTSALCEAIERYSGVYRSDTIEHSTSFDELRKDAFHPNTLMHFSERQFRERTSWNQQHESDYHRVPKMFDEHMPIHWTPIWSLTNSSFKYVPSAYCYYGHPDLQNCYFCTCDANGNAAGNTLEEAILQGFMELVERDSVCLWWYNRVSRPAVDLASFGQPYFDQLQEHYRTMQRDLWVLDITSDLGIPAFAAVSRCTNRNVEDILLGFGAHFDAKIAIMRALTEVNQFLPVISKRDSAGNTIYTFHEKDAITWWKQATIQNQPYVVPDKTAQPKRASDYANQSSDDLKADVELCVNVAQRHGMEMLVLDQTQPDIGLRVVKVIVPELRHFWKRFGPGRLYDTPVALGWLERPLTEEELNPIGIFF